MACRVYCTCPVVALPAPNDPCPVALSSVVVLRNVKVNVAPTKPGSTLPCLSLIVKVHGGPVVVVKKVSTNASFKMS